MKKTLYIFSDGSHSLSTGSMMISPSGIDPIAEYPLTDEDYEEYKTNPHSNKLRAIIDKALKKG